MNVKGLGQLVQHVDKLAVAAALVIGGFLIWRYSAGNPYAVTVGTGRDTVTPAAVADRVLEQANRLRSQLNAERVPELLADFSVPDYTQDFLQRLDRSVVANTGVSVPLAQMGISQRDIAAESVEDIEYAVPTPPAPTTVRARAGNGVLDEQISPVELERLVALVGDRQPRDFHYVSVGGQFDVEAWLRAMDSVGQGRTMPGAWQRSSLYAVDVRLERQRWLPAERTWGETTLIEPLPGQFSLRGVESASRGEADAIHRSITDRQEEILRPAFVPLASGQGPPWRAPDEADAVLSAEQHERLSQLNRDIELLTRRIDTMQRTLDRQASRSDTPTRSTPTPSPLPDPNEDLGRLLDPGMPPGSTPRPSSRRQTPEEQLAQMRQERDQKLAERQALLSPVREGFEVPAQAQQTGRPRRAAPQAPPTSGDYVPTMEDIEASYAEFLRQQTGSAPAPSPGTPVAADADAGQPEATQQMRFWVHDITVEPGATYRYRVVIDVLNPLFRRQQNLAVEQRAQADIVAVRSQPSDWSDPVEIDPFVRFFLVGASAEQNTAELEVFRLYGGVQRSATFTGLHPGDVVGGPRTLRIGDQSARIDFSTGAALVDLNETSQLDGIGSDIRGLFANLDEGDLIERRVREDSNHPDRARYRNDEILWAVLPD